MEKIRIMHILCIICIVALAGCLQAPPRSTSTGPLSGGHTLRDGVIAELYNVSQYNESTKQHMVVRVNLSRNYSSLCGGGDCSNVSVWLFADDNDNTTDYRYRLVNFTQYNDTRWLNNASSSMACTASSCYAYIVSNKSNTSSFLVKFEAAPFNANNSLGVLMDDFSDGINSTYAFTSYLSFNNTPPNGLNSTGTSNFGTANHRYPYDYGVLIANITDNGSTARSGIYLGNTTNTQSGGSYGCVAGTGCTGPFYLMGAPPHIGFMNSNTGTYANDTTLPVVNNNRSRQYAGIRWGLLSGTEQFVNSSTNASFYSNGINYTYINNWSRREVGTAFNQLQFQLYGTTLLAATAIHSYCMMSNRATIHLFGCTYSRPGVNNNATYVQALNLTGGGGGGIAANYTANFSFGVYNISFNPASLYSKNVAAANQTGSIGVINISNNGTINETFNISMGATITGITIFCAPNYNKTGALTLTTSAQNITMLTAGQQRYIWCWANFSRPSSYSGYFTVTVVAG